jgi:hypothetical protein
MRGVLGREKRVDDWTDALNLRSIVVYFFYRQYRIESLCSSNYVLNLRHGLYRNRSQRKRSVYGFEAPKALLKSMARSTFLQVSQCCSSEYPACSYVHHCSQSISLSCCNYVRLVTMCYSLRNRQGGELFFVVVCNANSEKCACELKWVQKMSIHMPTIAWILYSEFHVRARTYGLI